MAVRNKEIIQATTDAATSGKFNVLGTQSINAGPLLDGESVLVEYTHDGTIWQPLKLNGVTQEISIDHSLVTINGPGSFRCTKSITANPISVTLWITGAEQ